MKRLNSAQRVLLPIVLLGASAATSIVACGNPSTPIASTLPQQPSSGRWALKVQVGPDRRTVAFVPGSSAGQVSGTSGTKSLKIESNNIVLQGLPAFQLILGAAATCGVPADQLPTEPWAGGEWFVFRQVPALCDDVLDQEQTLICMADKLNELSDAVNVVTWSFVPGPTGLGTLTGLPPPWQIEPQSDLDRFIARDAAIYTAAHIAQLDALQIGGATCAQAYAATRQSQRDPGTLFDPNAPNVRKLASPASPGDPQYAAKLVAAIDDRLNLEVGTLRAGAQLLHDLVQSDVFADMAGALDSAGKVSDPLRANKQIWGDDGDPYNSLAHATRVLAGRWEGLADTTMDPKCQGLPAMDLLSSLGGEKALRELDVPIGTQSQGAAATLISRAGIVIDASKVTDAATLRGLVREQIIIVAAASSGAIVGAAPNWSVDPSFTSSPPGMQATRAVDNLSDGDLRFAVDYTARTFKLVTRAASLPTGTTGWPAGTTLSPFAYIAQDVATSGTVVQGGMTRDLLPKDIRPRLADAYRASYCQPPTVGSAPAPDPLVFQDSFGIANAFSVRLADLQNATAAIGTPSSPYPPQQSALGGVAEMRTWAGNGAVSVAFDPGRTAGQCNGVPPPPPGQPPCIQPQVYTVTLSGFTPQDFGVASLSAVEGLGVTDSMLAMADDGECAAMLRPDCAPATVQQVLSRDVNMSLDGTLTVKVTGPIPIDGGPTFALPKWLLWNQGRGTPAHLLAPFGAAGFQGVYRVSPMRDQLINNLFSFDPTQQLHDPRAGDQGAGRGNSYCVPGVAKDLFVPLENDFTSDGTRVLEDSWKHYLSVAQAAAAYADNLGNQLIGVGIQQDQRTENAAQQLATLCGETSALGQVQIDPKGVVQSGAADDSLKACLAEPTCDLVFLSDKIPDTKGVPTNTPALPDLAKALNCGPNTSALCTRLLSAQGNAPTPIDCAKPENKSRLGDPAYVSYGFLGLYHGQPAIAAQNCDSFKPVLDSLRGGAFAAAPFSSMLQSNWASPTSLQTRAQALQMTVYQGQNDPANPHRRPDASWVVMAANTPIMDTEFDPSSPSAPWPACLKPGAPQCDSDSTKVAGRFNLMFRSTCPGGGRTCALGIPEGGDPQAELNILRWRVQGALWVLGMLGGSVPEGMFTIPVPAADFSATRSPPSVPLATIYGASYFDGAGNLIVSATMSQQNDANAVGTTSVITAPFTAWGTSKPQLPQDYQTVYTAGQPFRHIVGLASSGIANAAEANAGQSNDPSNVTRVVNLAGSATCPDYYGGPAPAASFPAQDFFQGMAGIKNAWNTSNRIQGAQGNWFSPDSNRTVRYYSNDLVFSVGFGTSYDYPTAQFMDPQSKDRPLDVWCLTNLNSSNTVSNYDPNNHHFGIAECKSSGTAGGDPLLTIGGQGENAWNTAANVMLPSQRMRAWLNASPPPNLCGGLAELLGAYAIACTTGDSSSGAIDAALPQPPPVTSEDDLVKFQAWLGTLQGKVKQRAQTFYVQGVPRRALLNQVSGQVLQGSLAGTHGATVTTLENGLAGIANDWTAMVGALQQLSGAVTSTQNIIGGLDRQTSGELRLLSLGFAKSMISDSLGVLGGIASAAQGNVGAAANALNGAADLVLDVQSYNTQVDLTNDRNANAVLANLLGLASQGNDTLIKLNIALTGLRTDANTVSATGAQLLQQENTAAYWAAVGQGADYMRSADESITPIPLNTVLRRQYDGLRMRYQAALLNAKGLAYIARRAIEQRIGVSLGDIHDAVGPLDPPATWADSVCHLAGVDYQKLRGIGATLPDGGLGDGGVVLDPATGDGGFDQAAINAYADGFIGDYVAKLQAFTDYYNIQYPTQDSDDTAILSVREDFLARPNACMAQGVNLLYYSSQLDVAAVGPSGAGSQPGWEYTPCVSDAKCIFATHTFGAPDAVGPLDAARAHVTLLADQPNWAASLGDGGVDGGDGGPAGPHTRVVAGAPPGFVSQPAALAPGAYVLSWWDQARAVPGSTTLSTSPYRVAVFDATWNAIASFSSAAHVPLVGDASAGSTWSDRRSLTFTVNANEVYHIAFAASGGDATPGAVAISGVQLEKSVNNVQPTAYVETTSSLLSYSALCPASTSTDLRAAFTRNCDPTGACYYELNAPITIDSLGLQKGQSPLSGKIARGNINYRHGNVAINLVGTGLRDCGSNGQPSCYGSGYLEYTLAHDAQQVPILDWNLKPHYFDFGTGTINHGKALSAERYITLPLSSGDLAMVSQPGIQKGDMSGRPLDGRYRLRIWDDPALQWNRLEDVQIVLQYHYWSRVQH